MAPCARLLKLVRGVLTKENKILSKKECCISLVRNTKLCEKRNIFYVPFLIALFLDYVQVWLLSLFLGTIARNFLTRKSLIYFTFSSPFNFLMISSVKRLTWRSLYSTFYFFWGSLAKLFPTMCNSKLHWDKNYGKFGKREKTSTNGVCKYLTTWRGHYERRVKQIRVALWTPSCNMYGEVLHDMS